MNTTRFKNYALWVAVFAFVPLLLEAFGLSILPANYQELTTSFLGILVLAGIVNDPTTRNKGFLDDNK